MSALSEKNHRSRWTARYPGHSAGVKACKARMNAREREGIMTYRITTNAGQTVDLPSWAEAKHYARLCGAVAFYDCDDGRTFFYSSQSDCDAGENGLEIGAIEEVAQ